MNDNKSHHMMIRNRNSVELTGINKIESVNKSEFILETNMGKMVIWGSDLEITLLDVDKGNLNLKGHVSAIEYDDHYTDGGSKKSFLSKIFK